MCIERSLRCLEQPMRKRISLEARVWAASARTSFSSSIPFSRSTRSSGRRGVRARRLFRHHRSGTTDRSCRVLHLQGVPTSGALRFEAECQPIGVFPARQTRGSMCSEPHRSAFPALAAEGEPTTGFSSCQLEIGPCARFSAARSTGGAGGRAALRRESPAQSAFSRAAPAGTDREGGRREKLRPLGSDGVRSRRARRPAAPGWRRSGR